MANNEGSKARAKAKQHESILVIGVIRIIDKQRSVVQENGLRLLERDTVLLAVGTVLPLIPFEPQVGHSYSVVTL